MSRLLFAALACAALAHPGHAQPTYPDPPEDFAHADEPHGGLLSVAAGRSSRRLLVILVRFDDVATPLWATSAWARNRVFGTTAPSVADFYRTSSFGQFGLRPAAESQGLPGDGVVAVNVGDIAPFLAGGATPEAGRAVAAVDRFVDFSAFDDNGDGQITSDELGVLLIRSSNPTMGNADNGGAARSAQGAGRLDGVDIRMSVALSGTATNLVTQIHEIGHVLLDTPDTYGWAVGRFSVSGPTIGWPDATLWDWGPWEKLHLGWITPTVVTEDGWYTIDEATTTGQTYVLYDPERGPSDYFLVQNRQLVGYDVSASDNGLVVWRIDDPLYGNNESDNERPVQLMMPGGRFEVGCSGGGCYGGSNRDAFDYADTASLDTNMLAPWRDGDPARVGVRAIGASGTQMRAYFDVRGPGALVDVSANERRPPSAVPGGLATIRAHFVYTADEGEPARTFRLEPELPRGWSVDTGSTASMNPQRGLTFDFELTVADDAPAGRTSVPVRMRDVADPSFTARGLATVVVEGQVLPPDPLEPNDAFSTLLSLTGDETRHTHYDARVLDDRATVNATAEVWRRVVGQLNLHDAADRDQFLIELPDVAVPADGGHPELAGLTDGCGRFEREDAITGETQDVLVTARLDVHVLPPPRNAPQETLELSRGDGGSRFHRYRLCPSGLPFVRFGALVEGGPRVNFPEYGLALNYRVDFDAIPPEGTWLTNLRDNQAARAIPLPCGGGRFPGCDGPGLISRVELVHPVVPEDDCLAGGCPDHYFFNWDAKSTFAMRFDAEHSGVRLELLNAAQQVLATARAHAFGDQQGPNDPPPNPPPNGPFAAELADDASLVVPDLPAGFYVLRVTGPATTLRFEHTPAGDPDTDGDGVPDDEDACPVDADDQGDVDQDGIGDACDPENTVRVDVRPGVAHNRINLRGNGRIHVAVMGSAGLDVGRIDAESACFAGDCDGRVVGYQDVDQDGHVDLRLRFRTRDTDICPGDTEACVTATLDQGALAVTGCDRVRPRWPRGWLWRWLSRWH